MKCEGAKMSKRKKLYNLRFNISNNAVRIKYLLENAIYKSDNEMETSVLGSLALELAEDIKINSEKIGKILKH
jgi:hypothetical protein